MSLSPSGRIKFLVTGARGATFSDVARQSGAYGAETGDSDAEVLDKFADYVIQQNPDFKGDKGDPGGNVLSVGPFSSLSESVIPAGTNLIQTSDRTRGILIEDSSLTDADVSAFPLFITKTANSRYFRFDDSVGVKVSWSGAIADGVEQQNGNCNGTDNTDLISATIAYAMRNGGNDVWFDEGIYVVAKAPSGVANAQISLPIDGNQADQRVLRLRGACPQSMTWATNQGTILRSTYATSADACMIGAKHPGRGGDAPEQHSHAVWLALYAQDIIFRTAPGHPITHVNAEYLPFYNFTNSRFDVPNLARVADNKTAVFTNAEPTTSTSYGLKGAKNDLPLRCLLNNVCFAGCYTGYKVGELSGGDNLTFIANKRSLEVPNIRHGAKFGYVLLCNNQSGIIVTADEPAKLLIDYYDIEHNDATASGSGPSWVTPLGDDINDPNFMLYGECMVHYHSNNFVTNLPFKINGKSVEIDSTVYLPNFRLKFVELDRNNEWPTPLFFPGFYLQDAAVHVVRRGVETNDSKRVAWQALASKQLNMTNGLLGGYVFLNESIADGSEKRMAGVISEMNGLSSGSLLFYTNNGGQFVAKWGINPSGDMRSLTSGAKLLAITSNTDRSGTITLSNQNSFTRVYDRPYNSAPVVQITPGVLPADAIWRVQSYADRFVLEIKKTDDMLYAVSGSLHYSTIGNPD